ncbi:MAG TPA: GNAT family N-acyltransferase [Castellaniella sp.]|uniref:GNAT family N-acetyltransferase n=1 Tax=Castellaniella sp. TaxID=1955812 RepID=UPI002EFEEF53
MPSQGLVLSAESARHLDWPGLAAGGLTLSLARTEAELAELQRLRLRIFSTDMGASFPEAEGDRDVDRFDPWCVHFVVRDMALNRVVGTYRVLTPEAAVSAGRYYSDAEFDLSPLAAYRSQMVEVGRSCIDAGYRHGTAIMLLWSGLAQFMMRGGYRYMVGCASVSLRDGGATVAEVWRKAAALMASRPEVPQVRPLHPYPVEHLDGFPATRLPPLIKGYLKLGCMICGAPAWDPDFHTADFPILLDLAWLDARYRHHFGMG